MKMMLVGKHAVGKSTIVALLQNRGINDKPTVGIHISEWKLPVHKKTFHFSIWNFAGQKEYYAIHRCFLSKRTLYLLVWNITEGDTGIADLKPWLNSISTYAPDSCVIVVGTFLDKMSEEDRQSGRIEELQHKVAELTKQYRRLVTSNIMVGLKGCMENFAKLKDYIYNAAAEYKIKNQHVMGQQIPYSYQALHDKLLTVRCLVKDSNHEPVLHHADFRKMVRDLNLADICDDNELHMVTNFLHEVGALLYYDDHRHGLDNLYFVDPNWLCDLLSTIVTVKEQNPYMMQGILKTESFSENKHIPDKYFYPFLTLLNRFEIALPLDNDYKRILIPSMLSDKCPDTVAYQQLAKKNCYKRFILLHCRNNQISPHQLATGFWNILPSDIMVAVKEVRSALNKQVSIKMNYLILDHISDNGTVSETSSTYSNTFGEPVCDAAASEFLSTHKQKHSSHEESHGGLVNESLVYWRTGLFYNVKKLTFSIESLSGLKEYQDEDGVLIMASQGAEGCKVLGQLIDIVEEVFLKCARYLNIHCELEQKVSCIECIKSGIPNPCEFQTDQLLSLITDNKLTVKCGANHEVKLIEIVPDLLFQDFDLPILLDPSEVIYKQEKESLLGTGRFGGVYCGEYKNQAVAIRLYPTIEDNMTMEDRKAIFIKLRAESQFLQQLHHPSIVHLVGVTVHPTMSIVLEKAPEGSLKVPLLEEQRAFSRIILYRIAIQVASALCYLHNINIVQRSLKASNVLLWSLSPDNLINCKVTDFRGAAYVCPGGIRGVYGAPGFIAPEVAYVSHAKERAVYDYRADIFSFSMFLYQLLARRQPFHAHTCAFEIDAAIKVRQRPQLKDVPVAESGLYYMSRVMKLCWAGNPTDRPSAQQIVEWLSASALQLIISVVPVRSKFKYCICDGSIVTPVMSDKIDPVPTSSELWICCDGEVGAELSIFTINAMLKAGEHPMKENQVNCMKQCGEHVWVASRVGLEHGVVNIFKANTKDLIHNIKMRENAVSCITNSDQLVYMGTIKGYCFAFHMDVATIQGNSMLCSNYLSEHCVDGVALTQTCLWASCHNEIYFVNPKTLDLQDVVKRTNNTNALIGKMMLSDDGDQVWSAHLGGVIMSAWDARQGTHICDVDVGVLAEENCHIKDTQDRIMTAMCTALDTVWIGLANGYIMVFGMNSPGELLTYFRPYSTPIRFLSASKYPGPCQKEECMMLCGGKMYRPDDSFKELTDYERKKGAPVDTAGVAVLWEVLSAKYIRQVQYLSDGRSWLNYSTLEKTMKDTGFTESLKHCHSVPVCLKNENNDSRPEKIARK